MYIFHLFEIETGRQQGRELTRPQHLSFFYAVRAELEPGSCTLQNSTWSKRAISSAFSPTCLFRSPNSLTKRNGLFVPSRIWICIFGTLPFSFKIFMSLFLWERGKCSCLFSVITDSEVEFMKWLMNSTERNDWNRRLIFNWLRRSLLYLADSISYLDLHFVSLQKSCFSP